MQKVIVDTNVLISALIQRSFPYLIVREILTNDQIQLCLSQDLLTEYFEVLNRPKFAKYPDFISNAQSILAEINERSVKYTPKIKVDIIKDPSDNRLLELAATSKADFLITGNTNDFTMTTFKRTKIVSPKNYWEMNYFL